MARVEREVDVGMARIARVQGEGREGEAIHPTILHL